MYTYTDHMGTKTISIMDDVYELLKASKAPEESFSDQIRRLAKTKGSILEFAGAWSDMSEEEISAIKAKIEQGRKANRVLDIYNRK